MKKNKILSNQKLDFFFVSKLAVMVKDSFKLSHSINVNVTNPNEITSLFDSISYDKVNQQIITVILSFLKRERNVPGRFKSVFERL